MKILLICILIFFVSKINIARESGETEITTDEGIEVFQNEKYYLLKKNVKIESDNFTLYGDIIKIFFDKDLYDIKIIDAVGKVKLNSKRNNLIASGEKLLYSVEKEEIYIKGLKSKLSNKDTDMFSDGEIMVNNFNGKFKLKGENSKLKSQNILIEGRNIDGIFSTINEVNDIEKLDVYDENIAYILTDNTEMYANIVNYNKNTSLIELENNVKIIRDGETVTGDYGTMDTNSNSYKVKSKESKKVKVIILETDE